ncbi:MAG: helix-turn-helix transcriptional regulator [Ruminococcus sp.]|nr:helix-turn-helix transcriptional regulator [Ruminococcus sp.]
MDVTEKIKQLLKQRGWSAYRLAKESDLSDSTIANIIKRNAVPSVTTLESICKGFGITMSQFFADGELIEVNDKTRDLLDCWSALSEEQRDAALILLKKMNQK